MPVGEDCTDTRDVLRSSALGDDLAVERTVGVGVAGPAGLFLAHEHDAALAAAVGGEAAAVAAVHAGQRR
ncbi:hypothetical protein OG963_39255 [Streptomyces sp. NBC_01707]|jgi:hypothetical protein|uniref:hypothetical protein n=1 Tax=Streptomyces sp. NBC_01707 TaxID=2975914 RepID=UPI00352EDB32